MRLVAAPPNSTICELDNTRREQGVAAAFAQVVEVLFSTVLSRCFFAKKIRHATFCRTVLRGGGVDVVEW
jgi:hypothetical protein